MSVVRRDGRERCPCASVVMIMIIVTLAITTRPSSTAEARKLTTIPAFGSVVSKPNVHELSRLVLGTVMLPRLENPHELLTHATDSGFTTFDLARTYCQGESERIFGDFLVKKHQQSKSSSFRESLRLVTKGGMGEDKYGDPNRPMASLESIKGELVASLNALHTNYVDMYMLHRDDPRIDVEVFVQWMNQLIDEGKIHSWGVSNWSLERIKEAHTYAVVNGLVPPTANSPQLSLAVPNGAVWPTTEFMSAPGHTPTRTLDWHAKNNVEVMGWESLAKGFMAVPDLWSDVSSADVDNMHRKLEMGEYVIGSDEWRMARIQRAYCTEDNFRRREIANSIAKNSGLSLAQVALLYSLSRGNNISVLVGAELPKHVDEMAELEHFHLDNDALYALGAVGIAATEVEEEVAAAEEQTPMAQHIMEYGEQAIMKHAGQFASATKKWITSPVHRNPNSLRPSFTTAANMKKDDNHKGNNGEA